MTMELTESQRKAMHDAWLVMRRRSDLYSLKAAMANLEDSDIDEIYRRTAYNIQKDINACSGFGEAIYDAVKERMATVLENYFKETIDD